MITKILVYKNCLKKENGRIIKETINNRNGYIYCMLNQRQFLKHRIIAFQFLPNPDDLPQIDHINQIKTDNRLKNLRWVTNRQNSYNRSHQKGNVSEYFDELPEGSQPLFLYNGHDLEGYSFDQEFNVYHHNGLRFRKLNVVKNHAGYDIVSCMTVAGKQIRVFINRLRNNNYE